MATSTEHDEQCEAEYVSGAGAWTLCDCLARRTPDAMQAVMFAPDGWDERTQSPVDEQVESLRDADPPPEPDTVIAECECWITPEWQWTEHYGSWYGNFCMSCNHPHHEGDCTPEEAL